MYLFIIILGKILFDIVSNLTEITTLILAIVAVVGLLFTYFFRPSKIEVEKRHSDDLKKVISQWKDEVVNLTTSKNFGSRTFIEYKPEKDFALNLIIEKEYTFGDVKNHIPSNLSLIEGWKNFKENWYDFEKNRYDLLTNIREDISKHLEMPYGSFHQDWDKIPCFSNGLLSNIYLDFSRLFDGNEPFFSILPVTISIQNSRYYLSTNNQILWVNTKKEAERKKELYENLVKNIPIKNYLKKFSELKDKNERLIQEKEEIERKLNFLAFIPLLPGKCNYLKWSLPGLIEKVRNQVKKNK